MDGLTISTAKDLLSTKGLGDGFSNKKLESFSGEKSEAFSDTLSKAITEVNDLQVKADKSMQDLSTGKNTNIADVMIATEKADIAFKLMVQVRNKVIDAYREIIKMQV